MKLKNALLTSSFLIASSTSMANSYICEACPAGTYSNGEKCEPCEAGTYSHGIAEKCSICKAGTYSKAGASECSSCAIGTYSTGKAGTCSNCSAPTYTNWGGNCGSATRSKTTYCTSIGSTSPQAFPVTTTETTNLGNTCGSGTYCPTGTNVNCTACPSIPYRAHYTLNCSWSCDAGSTLRNGKCCIQKSYKTTRYEEHCICGSITVPTHDAGPARGSNRDCSWTGYGGEYSGCIVEQVAIPTTETYWSCDNPADAK